MISKTTKKDEYGWYYTFRKRNDETIIIQQKYKNNKGVLLSIQHREIHIYGKGVIDILKEVINFEKVKRKN